MSPNIKKIISDSEFPKSINTHQQCPASCMNPEQRKQLSIRVLSGKESVTELARENNVSRKFLYVQSRKADDALEKAFKPVMQDKDVLFYIPVTKEWLKMVILSLILICHSSYRGVVEFLRDVIGYNTSVGTVHNIIKETIPIVRSVNNSYDLSGIKYGAHDELFQGRKPVLAGIDTQSAFCYLLAQEDHRDADTWGFHLLDLNENQGLHPETVVADAGKGLRAGQAAAWPDVPCRGDVFHGLQPLQALSSFLENRAFGAITAREKIEAKMLRAKGRAQGNKFSRQLGIARAKEEDSIYLYDSVKILTEWMQKDILSLAGPGLEERRELFDFVVCELRSLEPLCSYRMQPVLRYLKNQREDLLAFAGALDEKLRQVSIQFEVDQDIVRDICMIQGISEPDRRWQRQAEIQNILKDRFHSIFQAVINAMEDTPRASSIVENFNGRLRSYFSLRRHLGTDYLELLKFYLNHRKFPRSRKPDREGKSPAELLTGQKHPHWLQMIGFSALQF